MTGAPESPQEAPGRPEDDLGGPGHARPRIGPPEPAHAATGPFLEACDMLGIEPMPWQDYAARFTNATRPDGGWLYRRVALIVARQNGKTTLLDPLITSRLMAGRTVLHSAHRRHLTEETFNRLADVLDKKPGFRVRRGRGSEDIRHDSGGRYLIFAPRSGVRGFSADDVIVDEARFLFDYTFLASVLPTQVARPNPQVLYTSNAGSDESQVLNDLRERRDSDTGLAYLEWSAGPERNVGDREGWREANPALGTTISYEILGDKLDELPPNDFETEHLCRWVVSLRPQLLDVRRWQSCRSKHGDPRRPFLGVAVDGNRASAVLAWQSFGELAVKVIADVRAGPGTTLDLDRFGYDLRKIAIGAGVQATGFGPWTDADLARYLPKPKPIDARAWANASESFVRLVETRRVKWTQADEITEDLPWTAREPHDSGAFIAIKARDDRPVTAVLAGIRALWLASGPRALAPAIM